MATENPGVETQFCMHDIASFIPHLEEAENAFATACAMAHQGGTGCTNPCTSEGFILLCWWLMAKVTIWYDGFTIWYDGLTIWYAGLTIITGAALFSKAQPWWKHPRRANTGVVSQLMEKNFYQQPGRVGYGHCWLTQQQQGQAIITAGLCNPKRSTNFWIWYSHYILCLHQSSLHTWIWTMLNPITMNNAFGTNSVVRTRLPSSLAATWVRGTLHFSTPFTRKWGSFCRLKG